jgi:hypothetical protein
VIKCEKDQIEEYESKFKEIHEILIQKNREIESLENEDNIEKQELKDRIQKMKINENDLREKLDFMKLEVKELKWKYDQNFRFVNYSPLFL